MAWAKNGTPDTVSGAAAALVRISDLTATKFNQFMSHELSISGSALVSLIRFDNLSTSTYAQRHQINGGVDGTAVSQTKLQPQYSGGVSWTFFGVFYLINITGEEKLMIGHRVEQNTAGAANAPYRYEIVGKETQSAQYTDFQLLDDGAGAYEDIDSNLSALGTA
jgi:hypothetical protein